MKQWTGILSRAGFGLLVLSVFSGLPALAGTPGSDGQGGRTLTDYVAPGAGQIKDIDMLLFAQKMEADLGVSNLKIKKIRKAYNPIESYAHKVDIEFQKNGKLYTALVPVSDGGPFHYFAWGKAKYYSSGTEGKWKRTKIEGVPKGQSLYIEDIDQNGRTVVWSSDEKTGRGGSVTATASTGLGSTTGIAK